ncbi:MAG TPA: YwpF family protein [Candidatus Dormibacteraeota bacterium]|nr:YwpF family protein [Candidatus Dormibacteraeota bacterium]
MKTFMLKAIDIIENSSRKKVELIDGLIINREDEENQWIIEAYIDQKYLNYFQKLQNQNEKVMIEVKITKETNDPATFITSMIGLNKIGTQMNVLFKGTIAVDQYNSGMEQALKSLIDQGYQGEELLEEFKALLQKQ